MAKSISGDDRASSSLEESMKPTSNDDRISSSLDESMKFVGFKHELTSDKCVQGRFVVSERCCQGFRVLHGGVSALIAESLASKAAHIACGQRVAGIELSINHLEAVPIGTEIFASAKPVHIGQRLHVWDVTFSKVDNSTQSASEQSPSGTKIAVSRVTIMVGLPNDYDSNLKPRPRL